MSTYSIIYEAGTRTCREIFEGTFEDLQEEIKNLESNGMSSIDVKCINEMFCWD